VYALRAFLLKDQLHIKPCERCGLHYDKREAMCPHCGDLDDDELRVMLAEKEEERKAGVPMGKVFLLIGAVLGALVLIGLLIR
jgi:ribosomal protein L37E